VCIGAAISFILDLLLAFLFLILFPIFSLEYGFSKDNGLIFILSLEFPDIDGKGLNLVSDSFNTFIVLLLRLMPLRGFNES